MSASPPKLRSAMVMVVMDARSSYSNDRLMKASTEPDEDFAERVKQKILRDLERFR